MNHGDFRGPLPPRQQEIIHYLAEHHKEITRKVELTEVGYTATTTSSNEMVVENLKNHFRYMKQRLDSGAMVRRWDPAYAELTDYYDQLEVQVKELETGIQVTVNGTSENATKVAHNHAKIVSEFVEEGPQSVQREHAPAVE